MTAPPAIARHASGVTLAVRVKPKAKLEGLQGVHDGALRVSVQSAPEQGRANEAVCRLLARLLDLSPKSVRVLSGQTSPRKVVLLEGVEPERIEEALRAALARLGGSGDRAS